MTTILHEQQAWSGTAARADGDRLWLNRDDVAAATGWQWKPEGFCQGDVCVPLPGGANSALVDGQAVDVAGVWRHMGHPVVHDETGEHWVLGVGAQARAESLTSLEAADFALPDLDGRTHRLSDYRGRKVLLATWASW